MGCGASQQQPSDPGPSPLVRRPSRRESLKLSALAPLAPFDDGLIKCLGSGAIRLLDAEALRADKLATFASRKDLEARGQKKARVFLPPQRAAEALRGARRHVCMLTHAWRTPTDPDPDGSTFTALQRFLRDPLGAHIVGVFVDFACLHQHPRTNEQDAGFSVPL